MYGNIFITFLLLISTASFAKKPESNHSRAAEAAGAMAAGQGVMQMYLMSQMSKTSDPAMKNALMMMMMQSQMQQAAAQQAQKKNKENDEKTNKNSEDDKSKMPQPSPAPQSQIKPEKPEENLNMVENAMPKSKAEKEPEQTEEPLPGVKAPEVAKEEPKAEEIKAPEKGLLSGNKSTPNAIEQAKKDLKAEGVNGLPGAVNPRNDLPPTVRGLASGEPGKAQEAAPGAEAAPASIRKTDETAAADAGGPSGGAGKDSDGENGGGGAGNDFFASLMEKMNGEGEMEGEATHGGEEPVADASDETQLNIFQFASLRYKQSAYQDGRLKVPFKPVDQSAAMR